MIDWNIFSRVKPNEFLFKAWQRHDRHTVAPNLTAFAERFDKVSFWVATTIVTATSTKKQVAAIEKFVEVMQVRAPPTCRIVLH